MGPSVDGLIQAVGYPGIFACLFAETGLLLGFFLPGDTLLIAAGVLAERGQLSIALVIAIGIAGAVFGDATGYYIGRRTGPLLFRKDTGRFFPKRRLLQAQRFYERHGGKTIFIARFIGYVRTAAPTVAGAAEMGPAKFFLFNIAGGVAWVFSLALGGYFFGSAVGNIEMGAIILFGGALILSISPAIWHLIRRWRSARAVRSGPHEFTNR